MASESDPEDSDKKENHSSKSVKHNIMISSAYHLNALDNPGTPLVAMLLQGDNYRNWARSMKTALRAKTKMGFIDGSIKKPSQTSESFYDWEKADSMVTAWIINSINPALHGSISHATTARDIWLDLEERFAQTNAPRIHQLWRDLCLMQQEPGTSISDHYTRFKTIFDELSELQPLPECTCGASKELAKREEDQRVHLFLGSLDSDQYVHVKGTILNSEPMPSLRRAFNHIQREESRLLADRSREGRRDVGAAFRSSKSETGTALYTSRNKNKDYKDNAQKPKCDHCGKLGHEKPKCFEIVGYPSWWDVSKTNRRRSTSSGGAHLALADNGSQNINSIQEVNNVALHGSVGIFDIL